MSKRCCKCKHELDESEFYVHTGRPDGLRADCKLCGALYNRIQMCENKNNRKYADYGGRGITVSSELHDYRKWYDYLSSLPDYGKTDDNGRPYTIDRIDNSCGYEVGNIRWTSYRVQQMNRRNHEFKQSRYRGVSLHHTFRWAAEITSNYKKYHLGVFDSEEDAALAYDKAARELHGEHAYQNFSDK